MIFKNSVLTLKKTQHFAITKISWLVLIKEITIPVHFEKKAKPVNKKIQVYLLLKRAIGLHIVFSGL
jgi:hypothetical protein